MPTAIMASALSTTAASGVLIVMPSVDVDRI